MWLGQSVRLSYLIYYNYSCVCGIIRWPECLEHQADILLHESDSCEVLHELLALTSVPVRYEVVPELSTTLQLALNHANKTSRLAALRHLSTKLSHGQLVCHCTPYYSRLLSSNLKTDQQKKENPESSD